MPARFCLEFFKITHKVNKSRNKDIVKEEQNHGGEVPCNHAFNKGILCEVIFHPTENSLQVL